MTLAFRVICEAAPPSISVIMSILQILTSLFSVICVRFRSQDSSSIVIPPLSGFYILCKLVFACIGVIVSFIAISVVISACFSLDILCKPIVPNFIL